MSAWTMLQNLESRPPYLQYPAISACMPTFNIYLKSPQRTPHSVQSRRSTMSPRYPLYYCCRGEFVARLIRCHTLATHPLRFSAGQDQHAVASICRQLHHGESPCAWVITSP